jgi:hypothetical protein
MLFEKTDDYLLYRYCNACLQKISYGFSSTLRERLM